MRDAVVFLIVMLVLSASVRRPFVGLLLFSWLAYMRPQDLCWGFARTMRLSFVVAFVMVAGWLLYEKGRRPFTQWDVRTTMMCLLVVLVSISFGFAEVQDDYTVRYFMEYLKIIAIALFTVGQVDSRQRLRALCWTIALSLGFFGVKNGLLGLARPGSQIMRGPGGMLEDNNDFALALTMNIPLLWYLGYEERQRLWVRRGCLIAVGLTVLTVLLTHSRGGFLAMVATAMWIAWRSGQLVRAVGVLAVLAALFPIVVPAHVIERLGSIGDTQESSANARLTAWAAARNMIVDNPIWGVGMRNFQDSYPHYSVVPISPGDKTYVAHNSYLQIWAESGTPAFVTYLVLLGSVFLACGRVFRIGRQRIELAWAANYARMMEATTVGFMVGAFFLNRGHFDLVYHWLALVTCLVLVVQREARAAPVLAAQGRGQGRVTVRWQGGPAAAGAGAGVVAGQHRTGWR
ncbi:MAG: putative O-glycosylation ligase, exosortase A system-associated [Planctomycetes bacterium]|nr:putative O-glycosylation ligase, exosortase A system-associated [Planctomycetota bacterium]